MRIILNELKIASKSVIYNYKQFIWFFFALFIIQTFFSIAIISSKTNINDVSSIINSKYDYHMVIRHANKMQYAYLQQEQKYAFANEHIYDVSDTYYYDAIGDPLAKFDVYIRFFGEDKQSSYRLFMFYHSDTLSQLSDNGFKYELTPLYRIQDYINQAKISQGIMITLVFILSVFLLTVLYNIRVNNYKFDYGIYMTFGANKKKLLKNSFWEMTSIQLITFLPALASSLLIETLICSAYDRKMIFTFASLVLFIVLSLAVNALSVCLPIIRLSQGKPLKLLSAEDNSNYVHSPRFSTDPLKKKGSMPRKIAFLSAKRFFKYNLMLLLTSVAFSSLFVAILFTARMNEYASMTKNPQFELTFNQGEHYDAYASSLLLKFEEIDYISKYQATVAIEIDSHILVNSSDVMPFTESVEYNASADAFANVYYIPYDGESADYLARFDYDGDLKLPLTDEKSIVISDSFDNLKRLSLKPGDKIKIAFYDGKMGSPTYHMETNDFLEFQLKYYYHSYEEYTVAAVIHNMPSNNNLSLYMPEGLYSSLTSYKDEEGSIIPGEIKYTSAYIYLKDGLSEKEINDFHTKLLRFADENYSKRNDTTALFVKNLNADFEKNLSLRRGDQIIYIIIGCMTFFVMPLVSFFSQTIFYNKRKGEFTLLRAIGATDKDVRNIHLFDSMILSLSSLALYISLTLPLTHYLFRILNTSYGLAGIRVMYSLPLLPFTAAMILTFAFAFLAAFLPYIKLKRTEKTLYMPESSL